MTDRLTDLTIHQRPDETAEARILKFWVSVTLGPKVTDKAGFLESLIRTVRKVLKYAKCETICIWQIGGARTLKFRLVVVDGVKDRCTKGFLEIRIITIRKVLKIT